MKKEEAKNCDNNSFGMTNGNFMEKNYCNANFSLFFMIFSLLFLDPIVEDFKSDHQISQKSVTHKTVPTLKRNL